MSYKYIEDLGNCFNHIIHSQGILPLDESLQSAIDHQSNKHFGTDLNQLVLNEMRTIFHRNNLDTFKELFSYMSTRSIHPTMLIGFFNITSESLDQLLSYMLRENIFFNGNFYDELSLHSLLHRFKISLWDDGGICEKAVRLGIRIDKKTLTKFSESDVFKISNKNLCTAGREYLIKKYTSKSSINTEIITHIFLDGKNKFCSLSEASLLLYPRGYLGYKSYWYPEVYTGTVEYLEVKKILKIFNYDLNLIKNTMKFNGSFLKYLPNSVVKKISNRKDFFISAGPQSARFASKKLLDDEEVAMHFLSVDDESLPFISSRLRGDYKFLIKFYKKNKNKRLNIINTQLWQFPTRNSWLEPRVLDNKWFVREHLKRVPADYILISKRLKKDLSILKLSNPYHNVKNLKFAGANILNDRVFLLPFIKKFKYPFKWASKKIKDDYELCDIVVSRYGSYIQYASDRLKDNKKLALKAVSKSYPSYKYLSKNMKKDRDVLIAAIQRSKNVCKFIPKDIRQDKKLWMSMIDKKSLTIYAIFFACHFNLRMDPDIYEKAFNKEPSLIGFFSESDLIKFNFKNINKSSRQVIYNIVSAASRKEDIFFLAWAKKHILEF
jgi:hypothetical protein